VVPRVRVPASTSNLGPGFDCLGLALGLFLEVELVPGPGRLQLECGTGCEDWPRGENLLLTAFAQGCERFGVRERGGTLRARSEIPVGRGLGSSGAAVIAGLCLAAAQAEREIQDEELLALGLALEGHPDNVTAALFGGCTLGVPLGPLHDGAPQPVVVVHQAVHPELAFAVAWPAAPLATAAARLALPATVPFADAVENPRRLALLLEGLRTGDARLLQLGGEDRLHVAARLQLIPGAERAIASAHAAGAQLATLSGAGSGVVAIGRAAEIDAISRAMAAALPGGQGRVVALVRAGPRGHGRT
jgi:homoserine kinase